MKDRAGLVGARGGYELLQDLQAARGQGVRIHLVAHSFGGKLLTAALTGHGRGPANEVDSFVILQGAFSHFSFATAEQIRSAGVKTDEGGLYVDVVRGPRVRGPLVVTYSVEDVPNRLLYGKAMRLSDRVFEAAGADRFGSLGADGVQGLAAQPLDLRRDRLGRGRPAPGFMVVNVDATGVIQGHSDYVKPPVFDLIWDAVLAGRPPRP
jgi:hypothetical protein